MHCFLLISFPGVGYSMGSKLAKLGVNTCADLQSIPVGQLRAEFGPKTGESLHRFSMGHDDREVKADKQRKSVSAEVNYGIRFTKVGCIMWKPDVTGLMGDCCC